MYLNQFAQNLDPLDLTSTEEFESLLSSARDIGLRAGSETTCRSRNLILNGMRFHYLEWGSPSKPPLVLLHGGNQTAHSWDMVSLGLAQHFHIVALDQRGHGDSEWPRDADMSNEAMTSDALAFVSALGIEDATLMGHSMGGQVTMSVLGTVPDLASRAVLVDIGPRINRPGTNRIRNFVANLGRTEFESLDEYVKIVAAYTPYRTIEHIHRSARYNLIQRHDGKYVAKQFRRTRVSVDEGIAAAQQVVAAQQAQLEQRLLEKVRRIEAGVLVVRGGLSEVLTAEGAAEFTSTLRDGQLVTVPGCGHNVHSQDPLAFLDAVTAFLLGGRAADVPARAGSEGISER